MHTLYLPVETAARELDAKLLLALYVADKGMRVIIGNRALMNNMLHRFEPGIYLSHNFDKGRRRILKLLAQMGHHVLAWDEEGLVWVDEASYCSRRVCQGSVARLETIFAWGKEHGDTLRKACGIAGVEVLETGNPRADLLRGQLRGIYAGKASELRDEFGDFILINSNFGWLNYALSKNRAAMKSQAELEKIALRSRHSMGYLKHRYLTFCSFIDLLPLLARRYPDRKIIVRPHPSENCEGWRQASGGFDNIEVKYDNDLVPWLLGAHSILHNGCTTAVEAALLGKTAIMYSAYDGGAFEISQPARVSMAAKTPEEIFSLIDAGGSNVAAPAGVYDNLNAMVSNREGRMSAEIIAEHMAGICEGGAVSPGTADRIAGRVHAFGRALGKSVTGNFATSASNPEYIAKKFPPMSAGQISARLAEIAGLIERPVPVVRELSDRVFCLQNRS